MVVMVVVVVVVAIGTKIVTYPRHQPGVPSDGLRRYGLSILKT